MISFPACVQPAGITLSCPPDGHSGAAIEVAPSRPGLIRQSSNGLLLFGQSAQKDRGQRYE